MAILFQNTFETALADETAITAANSDDGSAGTAFDAIGGECLFDNLRAAHGSLSCKGVVDAAEVANIDWSTTLTTVSALYVRAYFYRTSIPAAQQRLFRLKDSGNVDRCYAVWHTDGDIYCFDAAGAFYQITTDAPLNEWIRVELGVVASTTVGSIEVRLYQADSVSPLGTAGATNVNTGADIGYLSIGNTTANNCGTFWMDDLAAGDAWVGSVSRPGYRRLYGPALLGSSAATLFTATGHTLIRNIYANNPSGSPVDITLSIGADADATHIFDADTIAAGSSISARRETNYVLEEGEVMQGFASSAATVVMTINGIEQSL